MGQSVRKLSHRGRGRPSPHRRTWGSGGTVQPLPSDKMFGGKVACRNILVQHEVEAPLRYLSDETDPEEFVLSANMSRRNLDPSQRSIVMAALPKLEWSSNQHREKVEVYDFGSVRLPWALQWGRDVTVADSSTCC